MVYSPILMLPLFTALAIGLILVYNRVFAVSTPLRHMPRVPIIPLILSYVSGETEERRTLRLLLPCAKTHNSGLVLVWAFALGIVHCVDPKLRSTHLLSSSSGASAMLIHPCNRRRAKQ